MNNIIWSAKLNNIYFYLNDHHILFMYIDDRLMFNHSVLVNTVNYGQFEYVYQPIMRIYFGSTEYIYIYNNTISIVDSCLFPIVYSLLN